MISLLRFFVHNCFIHASAGAWKGRLGPMRVALKKCLLLASFRNLVLTQTHSPRQSRHTSKVHTLSIFHLWSCLSLPLSMLVQMRTIFMLRSQDLLLHLLTIFMLRYLHATLTRSSLAFADYLHAMLTRYSLALANYLYATLTRSSLALANILHATLTRSSCTCKHGRNHKGSYLVTDGAKAYPLCQRHSSWNLRKWITLPLENSFARSEEDQSQLWVCTQVVSVARGRKSKISFR